MPLIKWKDDEKRVRAKVDGRTFTVVFDSAGTAIRICERKKYGTPPIDGWYNAVYWSAKHHALGKGDTLPKRIIEAARGLQ
jgi:hypothetical protein